jgi:hypothetical protein
MPTLADAIRGLVRRLLPKDRFVKRVEVINVVGDGSGIHLLADGQAATVTGHGEFQPGEIVDVIGGTEPKILGHKGQKGDVPPLIRLPELDLVFEREVSWFGPALTRDLVMLTQNGRTNFLPLAYAGPITQDRDSAPPATDSFPCGIMRGRRPEIYFLRKTELFAGGLVSIMRSTPGSEPVKMLDSDDPRLKAMAMQATQEALAGRVTLNDSFSSTNDASYPTTHVFINIIDSSYYSYQAPHPVDIGSLSCTADALFFGMSATFLWHSSWNYGGDEVLGEDHWLHMGFIFRMDLQTNVLSIALPPVIPAQTPTGDGNIFIKYTNFGGVGFVFWVPFGGPGSGVVNWKGDDAGDSFAFEDLLMFMTANLRTTEPPTRYALRLPHRYNMKTGILEQLLPTSAAVQISGEPFVIYISPVQSANHYGWIEDVQTSGGSPFEDRISLDGQVIFSAPHDPDDDILFKPLSVITRVAPFAIDEKKQRIIFGYALPGEAAGRKVLCVMPLDGSSVRKFEEIYKTIGQDGPIDVEDGGPRMVVR